MSSAKPCWLTIWSASSATIMITPRVAISLCEPHKRRMSHLARSSTSKKGNALVPHLGKERAGSADNDLSRDLFACKSPHETGQCAVSQHEFAHLATSNVRAEPGTATTVLILVYLPSELQTSATWNTIQNP